MIVKLLEGVKNVVIVVIVKDVEKISAFSFGLPDFPDFRT
jgi:hypothetical protein